MALDEDLKVIYQCAWANQVNMEFNTDKFECLKFMAKGTDTQYLAPDQSTIKVKTTVKDLGVHLEDNLGFHTHIEKMVAGAGSTRRR